MRTSGFGLRPSSLRGRLAFGYVGALVIGFAIFAATTFAIVRALEMREFDQELRVAAHATAALIEIRKGRPGIEESDRRQFTAVIGLRTDAAVIRSDGAVLLTNVATPPSSVVASARTDVVAIRTIGRSDDALRILAVPVRSGGARIATTLVWRPVESFSRLERLVGLTCLAVLTLIALPAFWAGSAIGRRALAPIERFAAVAAAIEADDLSRRLPTAEDVVFELRHLSMTVNRMLDRLEAAFARQKRFTADASHELRTPLAVVLAETQLALERERDPAFYRRSLATVDAVGRDMRSLLERMLQAARTEKACELESVDAVWIVRAALEKMLPMAAAQGVAFAYSGLERRTARIRPAGFTQALVAVLDNAVRHSPAGGTVTGSVIDDGERLAVVVRDQGRGFTEEALLHGLERFWRGEFDERRTGIGLALAAELAADSHASVKLSNAPEGGALVVFTLRYE